MITAARMRPVRIAPRIAVAARALDMLSPTIVNAVMKRQVIQPSDGRVGDGAT